MTQPNEHTSSTPVSVLAGTGTAGRMVMLMTLGNALCGSMALLWAAAMWRLDGEVASEGSLWRLALPAGILVVMGVLLDGLDGWAARRWRVSSDFGALADAVADAISFVLAPAMLLVAWTAWMAARCDGYCAASIQTIGVVAALYYVFNGITRLRDHVRRERDMAEDDEQENDTHAGGRVFTGLPTTASGLILTWATVLMAAMLNQADGVASWLLWVLPLLAIALGYLMTSNVPVPHPLRR